MRIWPHSKIARIALLSLPVFVVLWFINPYPYQALNDYRCNARSERVIPQPNLILQDMLELYVGGWIEKGDVTISGLPSRENSMLKFSSGASVRTISHAYIGEWYGPDVTVVFEPTEGASCLVRLVYRYR